MRNWRYIVSNLLLIVMLSVPLMAQATRDSATWEGSYEATAMPATGVWQPEGNIEYMSFVAGGILNIDSYDDDWIGWWQLSDAPGFDFTQGATVEFRAKLIAWQGGGAAGVAIQDNGHLVFCELRGPDTPGDDPNGAINITNVASYHMAVNDDFHVYRVAISVGTGLLKVWVDNQPDPAIEGTIATVGAYADSLSFGDMTVTNDAEWDVDYIRWTNTGAYPPVGAAGYCGDYAHAFPETDLSLDCVVDMNDFALLAAQWLVDNRP